MAFEFEVIDNRTGMAPDCEAIALTEEWAKRLVYCDIDCFAITEEGQLVLIDDCNNIAYPPADRFTVTIDPKSLRQTAEWVDIYGGKYANPRYACSACGERALYKVEIDMLDHEIIVQALSDSCPKCGAMMKGGTP